MTLTGQRVQVVTNNRSGGSTQALVNVTPEGGNQRGSYG